MQAAGTAIGVERSEFTAVHVRRLRKFGSNIRERLKQVFDPSMWKLDAKGSANKGPRRGFYEAIRKDGTNSDFRSKPCRLAF